MVNAEADLTVRKRLASSISQSLTADAASSSGTPGAAETKKKPVRTDKRKYRDRTAYHRAYRQAAGVVAAEQNPGDEVAGAVAAVQNPGAAETKKKRVRTDKHKLGDRIAYMQVYWSTAGCVASAQNRDKIARNGQAQVYRQTVSAVAQQQARTLLIA